MALLKCGFTNSLRALPLVERTFARIPPRRALCATTVLLYCVGQRAFLACLPISSYSSFALCLSTVGEKGIVSDLFPAVGDERPPKCSTSMSVTVPWIFYVSNMHVLAYAVGRGPSLRENDLWKIDDMCSDVSPCAERFSDSPSGANLTFRNREHFFGRVETRSLRRNENQLYPR
jgi:hypothetical protein